MKKVFLIVLVSIVTFNAQSQSQKEDTPESIIKDFMSIYSEQGSKVALEFIFQTNNYVNNSEKQIRDIINQVRQSEELLGTFFSSEYIGESKIGSSLRAYSYLMKFDRQPLRFLFLFYKANDKWSLINFQFDDSFDAELISAIKLPKN